VLDTLEPATLGGEVAQSVEHTAENRGVAGSIPALATSASGKAGIGGERDGQLEGSKGFVKSAGPSIGVC
jgi:hypothetical protein